MGVPGYIHDGWFVLRLGKMIDQDFFYYLLISPNIQEQFNTLANGAIVKNIKSDLVKKATFPLPAISEQKEIVKKLDKLFAEIDKAKQIAQTNLENTSEAMQQYTNQFFSSNNPNNEEYCLRDLCETITSSKRVMKHEYVTAGIPFYRSKEIIRKQKNLPLDNILFIDNKTYIKYKKEFGAPEENDVLITAVGTIGVPYIVKKEEFYFKDGNLLWIRKPKKNISTKFLIYYFTSPSFKVFLSNLAKGASQAALTIEKLSEIQLSIPSLKEQQKIVTKLDKLSAETKKMEEIYKKKIEDLEELKKSLLKQAFEGKLV